MVFINGSPEDVAGMLLYDYLMQHGYASLRVAVELNGQILPSYEFESYRFKEADRVEIVHFVGGG